MENLQCIKYLVSTFLMEARVSIVPPLSAEEGETHFEIELS